MPKISQVTKRVRAANIVAGITKRLPHGEKYPMNGKLVSRPQLVAFFQSQIDALDAIDTARAVLASAVAKERVVARTVSASLPHFQTSIYQRFGFAPDALADFGFQVPKKPGPKTPAAKLAGAVKARATREARRTMGPKQRLKIRGVL